MQFMTSTGSNRAQGLLCYSQKVPLCPTMPPPGGSFVFQLLDVVPNKSVKIILHETQHTIRSLLFVVFLSLSLSLSVTMMFFRSLFSFFLSIFFTPTPCYLFVAFLSSRYPVQSQRSQMPVSTRVKIIALTCLGSQTLAIGESITVWLDSLSILDLSASFRQMTTYPNQILTS